MQVELNRTDYLYYIFKKIIGLYIYGLTIMTGFRLFFYFYFAENSLWQKFSSDIIYAFYLGFKYDTMVLSYLLLIPFLLLSLAALIKLKPLLNLSQVISGAWSYLVLLGIITTLVIDLGFYSYFQDHINILVFGILEDDSEALFKTIWKNYPAGWALLGLGVFCVIHFSIVRKIFKFFGNNRSLFQRGIIKFLLAWTTGILLIIIGSRGGVGVFVLAPQYAEFSQSQFINGLSLNGVFTLERAIKIRQERTRKDFNMAKLFGYNDNIHQAFNDYLEIDTTPTQREFLISLLSRKTMTNDNLDNVRPNVIVLVMESFGSYWMRYHSDRFNLLGPLEQLFKDGIYFNNFISSDNGTIGSLMVITTNIPNRPGARFLSESRYLQMPIESAAHIPYKERGYEASFIYGGKLGWRDIGKYYKIQGYHNVEGESHIRNSLNLKGTIGTEWGTYDGHFFDHILKKLKKAKRPQFVMALSTSNHPPFEWPNSYEPSPMEIPDNLKSRIAREQDLFEKRFHAFQYSNFMLGKFLNEIKNSSLAENTLVAVTGDHNFWGFINFSDNEIYEKYKVPFYLFVPDKLRPNSYDPNKFGSHEDIMPTLYNLTLSKTDYLAFGKNLLGKNESFSLNPSVYAGTEGVIDNRGRFFPWRSVPGEEIKLNRDSTGYPELEKYYRSVLSIADFYLIQQFEKKK